MDSRLVLAIDTEGWPGKPWSLQFSASPGKAYLIKATDRIGLDHFATWLHETKPIIIFHSALHDLAMLRDLGISTDGLEFADTMVQAYLSQLEPQGLKPSCLRHCGMEMRSYEDIVGNKANELARDYLTWLWEAEQADYEDRQHEAFAAEIAKGRRIKVLPKLPKTALLKAAERVMSSKRPAELWKDQLLDLQVAAYDKLGPLPEATLDYVDRDTAIRYGCRDADGTLRLHAEYSKRIDAMGLRSVYELEIATYPLLDRMQRIGIKPDLEQFKCLSSALAIEIETLRQSLEKSTGRPSFNANSGDQVASFLFGDLGLEEIKFTSSGRGSTNDLILEALENEHPEFPQITLIRHYREFYKLKHTFCMDPRTRVLTSNLTWRDIGSLKPGDVLLGFDENSRRTKGIDHHRHWRPSTIVSTELIRKPCYRLKFDDGTIVICSTDHRWLARSTSSYEKAVWVRTDELCREDRPKQTRHDWEIIKPIDMWESRQDFDAGYISGLLDGEGCLQRPKYGLRLVFAQKTGAILDSYKALLNDENFTISESESSSPCHHVYISKTSEVLRCLGLFRPIRILKKFRELCAEDRLPRMNMSKTVKLVSREYIGEQEVVALSTNTRTFVAEGLASHNCDRIEDYVNRWPYDGRIHTTLRTTRVVTGRLASADPNLLAQPEHGEWAEYFQRGWVADDGHTLCAWDQSQIELRGLAHLSQDPVLLAVYRGELRNPDGSLIDLHAKLAQRIFGGDIKDYKKGTKRLAAKAINFGLPMGMGPIGLSVQLRKNGLEVGEDDAQRWIDETFDLYKGVARYKQERIAEAQQHGFIRCLSGRIRYIGGIRSRNDRVREEGERFAFSTPIQESAQTIMKTSEVYIWREVLPEFWNKGIYCEPLLQVHDALKLEVEEGHEQDLNIAMRKAMIEVPAYWFSVPLDVEGKFGPNFADMVSFAS